MLQNIEELYSLILSKYDLAPLKPVAADYTGLFLPSVPTGNEMPQRRVMVVGQETRQWNGSLTRWIEASADGKAVDYIDRAMERYLETRLMPPSKYRFLQFLRQSERELSLQPHTLQWANLIACAYRRGSPKKRPKAELEQVLALSYDLLAAQIEVVKPQAILFTTGPGYDGFIKQFSLRFGGYSDSIVREPRLLWEFRLGDIPCFRTTHPRYAPGTSTRNRALASIADL
ncbi:hypothetical protein [Salinicola socius]|uniref:Uracil-DNA glycosylase-like domain-containing protein n=1 Tax=Salinicola socius TaxID=404433 RepID=A0A1Q8SPJ6_9GAMM|nr:hypothetical protein [Salinicola socius]OLO03341.1 hypothetical protein BTW07_14760 [Salinicola socius]